MGQCYSLRPWRLIAYFAFFDRSAVPGLPDARLVDF